MQVRETSSSRCKICVLQFSKERFVAAKDLIELVLETSKKSTQDSIESSEFMKNHEKLLAYV